jgi:NAD(P)-dependent dehydrogenase (short-subunit alcohol dehydrogenase family)
VSYDPQGRTVLITGAARGIGAETAVRLHGRGANVALVGLERAGLEALAGRLGDRVEVFEADVVDPEALERAVAGTVARFGGIDVAIANAGLHFVGALATAPIEQLERELEVNLHGVLHTVRAVLPHIVERRGYVLNVASLAAASHAPLMGSYSASKAGVEALTNCLRVELAPTGARVGCAYFGFIDTDLVRGGLSHPSSRTLERIMPVFVRRPVPVSVAVDAIERGILGRQARVWAPRYVGAALALRGLLQPLLERRATHDPRVRAATELADPGASHAPAQDPLLGVAAAEPAEERVLASATAEER